MVVAGGYGAAGGERPVTTPMTRNEQNSKSRAQTFGIRPDLFQAAQESMVKKSDLDELSENLANAGVRGYAASTMQFDLELGSTDSDATNSDSVLPYSVKFGPAVAAHTEGNSLQVEETGLWTATLNLYTVGNGHAPSAYGDLSVHIVASKERPGTGEPKFYEHRMSWSNEVNHQHNFSGTFSIDFPIEIEGTYVTAFIMGRRGRTIYQGAGNSRFSVRKTDNRTR